VKIHGGTVVTLATRGADLQVLPPDWRQRALSVIANPSIALVLMMIGVYGLIFEFMSPGFGVPGVVGAICLLLAMFALQMLPVNYAGLALIVLGVALFIAEMHAPSFGVWGVGGIVSFVAGVLLLFDRDVPGLGVPIALIFGLALASAAAVMGSVGMALKARHRPVVSGKQQLIGTEGVVVSSTPSGGAWAEVRGERWRVASIEPLVIGQRVRVVGARGLTLDVKVEPGMVARNEPGGLT
jgi:membrane-bound serine protease (ClpP class)